MSLLNSHKAAEHESRNGEQKNDKHEGRGMMTIIMRAEIWTRRMMSMRAEIWSRRMMKMRAEIWSSFLNLIFS